jgi:multiple sugar transport system substrate-binding protein
MYVRKDLFLDQKNRDDFKAKHGWDLPANEDDWFDICFDKFEVISEFFTRPEEDLYGTAIQYSKIYDFYTGSLYPFIWSNGGEIWDPITRQIEGVLNTDENAKMLSLNANFQRYQPPGALNFDIGAIVDVFTAGKVATAWQWAAMGPAMIPDEMKDIVWCAPTPGVRQPDGSVNRVSSIGGQPWVINAFNDEDHMRAVIDFLKWWYTTENQLEFARRGGLPIITEVLNSPGFDDIQPWHKVFKLMMQDGNSKDFWHEPTYAELLSIQQEAFSAFAAGDDLSPAAARRVLDDIARRQQQVLESW